MSAMRHGRHGEFERRCPPLYACCDGVDAGAVMHELQASLIWGIAGQAVRVIIFRAYVVVAVIGALSPGDVPSAVADRCLNAGYTSEANTHRATPETSHVTTTAITSITTSSRECAGGRRGERECCCKNCCEGEFLAHESLSVRQRELRCDSSTFGNGDEYP